MGRKKNIKKDKPKAQNIYSMVLTENQVRILSVALEEFVRLRLGQTGDLADDLAQYDFNLTEKEDPDRKEKFDAYIRRRDEAKEYFDKGIRAAQPMRGIMPMYSKERELIAEDMWYSIRHGLWLENGMPGGTDSRDSCPVYPVSDEPPIEFKKI